MLDGVGWAAGEIVFYMVVSALVGFAIGYVFVRWFQQTALDENYQADLAAHEERAGKAEHRLMESNRRLDKLQQELNTDHERIGELEAQLESARTALEAADDAEGVDDLRRELEACTSARQELITRVSSLEDELAKRMARNTELEGAAERAASLEDELAERDRQISDLEELIESSTRPGETPHPSEDPGPTKAEAVDRMVEIAARTAGDGPANDDDLKRVHGIGPKLERTLKELGITSFKQIANFEAEDITFVTAALDAFKGRIERDDWMSSAAQLHAEKYNEPL